MAHRNPAVLRARPCGEWLHGDRSAATVWITCTGAGPAPRVGHRPKDVSEVEAARRRYVATREARRQFHRPGPMRAPSTCSVMSPSVEPRPADRAARGQPEVQQIHDHLEQRAADPIGAAGIHGNVEFLLGGAVSVRRSRTPRCLLRRCGPAGILRRPGAGTGSATQAANWAAKVASKALPPDSRTTRGGARHMSGGHDGVADHDLGAGRGRRRAEGMTVGDNRYPLAEPSRLAPRGRGVW